MAKKDTKTSEKDVKPTGSDKNTSKGAANKDFPIPIYDVYGNLIREYSKEVHGEKYKDLAEQFCKKGYLLEKPKKK